MKTKLRTIILSPVLQRVVFDKGKVTIFSKNSSSACQIPFDTFSFMFDTTPNAITTSEFSIFDFDPMTSTFVGLVSPTSNLKQFNSLNIKYSYIAMDKNGEWYVFTTKPRINKTLQLWTTNTGEKLNLSRIFDIPPFYKEWDLSLHIRQNKEWVNV